jgi:DNA processing protein
MPTAADVELILRGAALPPRLSDLKRPPNKLYLRGELPRGPAVAIVGTRHPTQRGRQFARDLAAELAARGVAVLSGGATGIDTEAHAGALAADGCTVVVAAAGFDRPFPSQNAELYRTIVEAGGAYLSLVGASVAARRFRFLVRNGVLAALAHVVIVVQAPLQSGARNAAAHARRLGRPLLVVPGAPWSEAGAGCAEELRLGARPLTSANQVLDVLAQARLHPIAGAHAASPAQRFQQEMLPLFNSSASPADRGA